MTTDTDRLKFILEIGTFDGLIGVDKDVYDFATDVASEKGHEEPTGEDYLDGFRRLIDAGIDLDLT